MAPQIGSAGEAWGQQRSHRLAVCEEDEEGDDGPGMLKYGHTVQLSKVFLCCTPILLLKEPCRLLTTVIYPERGFF